MTPHPNQSIEETEELKCEDCDPKDEHIIPEDKSTTRISRPCVGCGKHQTIAGALLKSNYWNEWYKHASKNMLFDVDETLTVDAMSDAHFDSFINFILTRQKAELKEKIEALLEQYKDHDEFYEEDLRAGILTLLTNEK